MSGKYYSRAAFLIACSFIFTGCAAWRQKSPVGTPDSSLTLSHYAGSPLSGPLARVPDAAELAKPWSVNARIIAMLTLPSDSFTRFSGNARLIMVARGGVPVTPSAATSLPITIRQVPDNFELNKLLGDEKLRTDVSSLGGAVAPGTTAELHLTPAKLLTSPGRQGVTIRVGRSVGNDGYEISVVSDEIAPPETPSEMDAIAASNGPQSRQETILATRRLTDGKDRILLAIPMAFADSGITGVVIDISLNGSPTSDEQFAATIAKLKADIAASAAAAADRVMNASTDSAEETGLSSALSALAQTGDAPRGALAYLAGTTEAKLTESIVLVADNAQLQLLAKSISDRAANLNKRDRASVAWLLDRTTIAAIGALANDAAHPLSESIYGALITYGGDAGRQLDVLQSLASQSKSCEEMNLRLIGEQMIYLEDNSPASRVRAYDWLLARGLSPADYDPLGTPRERRAAIQKAQAAATQPTVSQ